VTAGSALATLALLHAGASFTLESFSIHWSTVIGLAVLACLYEWRAQKARTDVPIGRRLAFYAGLITVFLSLNGPLHDLSDYYLFSAHMVQHLILTLVVPPLLLVGTPGWMLRPALGVPAIARVARALTRPMVCFATFNVVLAAWHLPILYNYAMAHHDVHIVQHLMFMAAAVMLWWPVLSQLPELPRLSYPMQMLYLFLTSIPMSIVAVYITYSSALLYPAYAGASRVLPLTPMEDQLLGGLIMWIPGGLVFFGVITVIFFRWQTHGAQDSVASAQVDWRPASGA
jgi:putative membrane protein